MIKEILKIVDDFSQWRGNSFTLANLVSEFTKEYTAKAIEQDHPEAAEIIRGL